MNYFGSLEVHQLTPVVSGTAEELWQWAQGEKAIPVLVEDAVKWLGDSELPISEFPIRSRPYLTAPPLPQDPGVMPAIRDLTDAIFKARKAGASETDIRRAVELTISLPVLLVVPEFRDRLRSVPAEGKDS